ncbi:MAG: electron transfer flavoprotein subunit alpha/FixB family protein [Micromonosporaceae bacterium]|nr:electron transfer flavoprotein subunit alpha/FixB family protein [Micromonosporaceae bacterium]
MTDAATAALSERRTAAELADVVLASGTPEGREIAGRLAVRLKAAVITDVVALLPVTSDSGFRVKKTALADAFEVIVRSTRRAAVIVVAPEVASAVWAKTCETAVFRDVVPRVRPLKCPLRMGTSAIRVVERRARDMSERPDLSKAKVVVAGGRGTRGDFTSIEALADALGGATAASWAAVSAGWCSADRQVGQTGQRVSPRLYVAAGISGSVHHRVGMQDSQVVVAVNKDPDAPIFGIADFGIVGDLFTVLPQAVEEIARIRGRIGT